MEKKLTVTSTPHVLSIRSIEGVMKIVTLALLPAAIWGVYSFGFKALIVLLISIFSSVFAEWLFNFVTKKPQTIFDYSAVVTGLLLGMNLPASAPFWLPIVGSFFAIIIIKQLFGGLGQNFMNPALGARAFLLVCFVPQMTNWSVNARNLVDLTSSATPLGVVKQGELVLQGADYLAAFFGNINGSIGETSKLLLIVGGIFLVLVKVIDWKMPVIFIGTLFLTSTALGRNGLYEILIGGAILGAIFMATDYSTAPVTPLGQLIIGAGCGILTALLRKFGTAPESTSYAILIMNLFVPIIDKFTKPRTFGHEKNDTSTNVLTIGLGLLIVFLIVMAIVALV